MKKILLLVILCFFLASCDTTSEKAEIETERLNSIDWVNRQIDPSKLDSLENGRTYMSVYSEIYSISAHEIRSLTATISLRNPDDSDTLFISKADYFDTSGALIRGYVNKPIFILPMETIEVIIGKVDKSGGTGGNFVFDWSIKQGSNPPIFEGVMLSVAGTQGFSFVTRGWPIIK
jgi:hypothetical protein